MAPKVGPAEFISITRPIPRMEEELTHSVGAVNLAQLHTTHNQPRNNLPSPLHDCVLCLAHVEPSHSTQLLNLLHANQPLDAESPKRSIMTGHRDNNIRVDGVGIHAALIIMMHAHKCPVRNHSRNPHLARLLILTRNQILHSRGIEQLDVRHLQNLAHDGAREQCGVLDNDIVTLVLERNADLLQEQVSRLAHDHGRKQLATEPGATAGRDTCFQDGDFEVGTKRAQDIGAGEAGGACTDDGDVGLGVGVKVGEVAPGHGAGDGRLADGGEGEGVPVVEEGSQAVLEAGRGRDIGLRVVDESGLQGVAGQDGGLLGRGYRGGRHFDGLSCTVVSCRAEDSLERGKKHDPFAGIIQIKFEAV